MPFRAPSTLVAVVAGALMSACVVVPVTTEDYDADCQAITHHMELRTVQVAAINTIRPTAEPWSATRATARTRFDPNPANLVTHDPFL